MLTVEKAVLQIMDGTSDLCVISQKEMDLNDPETRGFLEKHMGRILADPAGREGQFWNDSGFAATMQRYNIGEIPFVEFAGVVGSACYESFRQLDKAEGADLVLAQFNQDGRSLIALMLLGHKSAYTHQALTEDGALSNQLLRHQAILPGPGQKLDSWAVADPFSFEVRFAEKRRRSNNQDFELLRQAVLQCDAAPSTRETVKAVQQMRGSASPSSPAAFSASCTPSRRCTPVAWSRSVPPIYTMCLRPCSSIRWASSRAALRSSLYTQATPGKRWPVTTTGTRQFFSARASCGL